MSVCFYHNDLDGITSAAIVNKKFKVKKFIPVGYNLPFPVEKITKKEKVYVVDYSPDKVEIFEHIHNLTPYFIWIDHHASSIRKFKDFEFLGGKRGSSDPAACRLTWSFCYPKVDIPLFVKLVSDFDAWKYRHGDQTKNLIAALDFVEYANLNPESNHFWSEVLNNSKSAKKKVDELCIVGERVRASIEKYRKEYAEEYAFEVEFEGLNCIAANRRDGGSLLFQIFKNKNYDAMISFQYCGRSRAWTFSIYSTQLHVDCSIIAEKYGGGGHKGAAGFTTSKLPFDLPKEKE